MRLLHGSVSFSLLTSVTLGVLAPDRSEAGLRLVFQDSFDGPAGSAPDSGIWTMATNVHTNNEVQDYRTSNQNLQISGGGTIQIVPRKEGGGGWTSGRIESKAVFAAPEGGVMQIEGSIRMGWNAQANKQGIWPAFWTMGDSVRHGRGWPMCGEVDIIEQVNGTPLGHATVHCGEKTAGGPCNFPVGRGATTQLIDDVFHTWAVRVDRSHPDWTQQRISWTRDGEQFHTLSGADIGNQAVWASLAHSPVYILLNVAVGGDWPGPPNANTMDGYGSMMEVAYVAVYTS